MRTFCKALSIGLAVGLFSGLMVGYFIAIQVQRLSSCEEIEAYSCSCEGDIAQLVTPCSHCVDDDWATKTEWNKTHLGDFEVYIIENFVVSNSFDSLKWEFKAFHRKAGSLMPVPMAIYYWNGLSWKQLYALDDENHVNEVFVEILDMPAESYSGGEISIKTTIRYSSHLVGAIPPHTPEQLWHYAEYFEGKMKKASA
jgi:hypothetical protein